MYQINSAYQWRLIDDNQMGVFVSYFRYSFAVVSFVSSGKSRLLKGETASDASTPFT
jgi:hypothetical protein